jgi:hypothetical protein
MRLNGQNMNRISSTIQGVGFLVLAMLVFSLQDIAVKMTAQGLMVRREELTTPAASV